MSADLSLDGISKAFGGETVLKDLDLTVDEGKMVSILGPSGCGKSTTLRIISGLVRQDRGAVRLGGKSLDIVPPHKRRIGFVFQSYALFPHLDAEENVMFGMKVGGMKKEHVKRRAKELLELVGMSDMRGKRPSQLSGGQKQRVAIARALAIDPQVLLLDEPFGALDVKIRRRLRRDLKALQKELGLTSVFVTHDQDEAFELGDTTAVMNRGRIEQIGRPRDLYERPSTCFVARFVGNVNAIELPGGDRTTVMVRPEDIGMMHSSPDRKSGVRGTLINYVYLGPIIECNVRLTNGESLNVIISREEFRMKNYRRGDEVNIIIRKFSSFSDEEGV